MVTYRCESGRERAPNEPSASDARACENVRLPVNHTICMPAKIGPKRDRALARTGCYFDGGAATCGVNAFSICGESGDCVVQVRLRCSRVRVRSGICHVIVSAANHPSFGARGDNGLLRCARDDDGYNGLRTEYADRSLHVAKRLRKGASRRSNPVPVQLVFCEARHTRERCSDAVSRGVRCD